MEKDAFTKGAMMLYDVATQLATKENKSHREVFKALCEYVEVTTQAELKQETIKLLRKEIKELKGRQVVLKAIKEGKVGEG